MNKIALTCATALLLTGCMVKTTPQANATTTVNGRVSGPDFLRDAAATCGNPVMLMPESRDYQNSTTVTRTNEIYDCVGGFLNASPEYRGMNSDAARASDYAYVQEMRNIDLQRSVRAITADQAKAAALLAAARRHGQ